MSLIKCADCGKEISNNAPNCPNCSAPMSTENLIALVNDSPMPMKGLISLLISKFGGWIDKR